MCKLLMSINPEHVDNILAGTKKFEFRKTKCKEKIDSILSELRKELRTIMSGGKANG